MAETKFLDTLPEFFLARAITGQSQVHVRVHLLERIQQGLVSFHRLQPGGAPHQRNILG